MNSSTLPLDQQLSTNETLQATITALRQTIAEQTLLIQQLQQQLEQLLRSQFGKKSERKHKLESAIKKLPQIKSPESTADQTIP